MTEHVRVRIEAGVLRLTLDRPAKKNALTNAMYGTLADALAAAEQDRAVRVVLFEAEGDVFSAGNDIGDFAAAASGSADRSQLRGFDFISQLGRAEKPYVAAVSGKAVGVGLTMLLHCDLVFVAEDAQLSAPFINLALVPEAASSLLLPARIGHARAFAMFALGEAIDGKTAAAIGLANAALPRAEVRSRALAAAEALAARPLEALCATKRLMRDAQALGAVMAREATVFAERLKSAEAAEAFQAFAERRAPDFKRL
ncbi:MAG TPA: enoyl-CoA hydratase-related protein [Polyangiales bacterium]|nr:enoyl-CoA hydratase-related protein [Polyangiales bacterium]